MKNIQSIIIIPAIVITTLIACSPGGADKKFDQDKSTEQVTSTTVKIPSFSMQDATGKTINLESLKGKKVFVNLWAAWCPPCKAEMPSIEALYDRTDKDKTVFILLSLDENFQSSLDFMKKNNFDMPVYHPSEKLPAMFNVEGIPATFIFNEAGELIKQNNGMDDYNTDEYVQLLNS